MHAQLHHAKFIFRPIDTEDLRHQQIKDTLKISSVITRKIS